MEGPTIEEYSVSQVPLQSLPDDSQTEAAPLSLPETPAPVNAVQPLLSEAESEESEEGDGHEETVEKDFLDHELDRQRAEEELKHVSGVNGQLLAWEPILRHGALGGL